MAKKIAIFGGGMAGLSAAHELTHRGFDVEVYETRIALGGKSASQRPAGLPAPTKGRRELPGEHGFRFFPGFYRNIIATLNEIPRPGGGTVGEDLWPSENAGITWDGGFYTFPRRNLGPSWDVLGRMRRLLGVMNFTATDLARMTWFRLKYLTSGPKRRRTYDASTWWEFIEGESPHYSARFREFEKSIPRTMSAMVAETSSAKIIGDITMQFLLGYGRPGNEEDRLLIGPSTERWIDPWRAYLVTQGVKFNTEVELHHFSYTLGTKRIDGAVVQSGTVSSTVTADYYLAALPIEVMQEQLRRVPGLAQDDPALEKLTQAPPSTAWMVGAQFYLAHDEPMADGHVFYPRSPWALTSVSQGQFWQRSGETISEAFGDASVSGILSVIIADWDTPDRRLNLSARHYPSTAALLEEVRLQLVDEIGGRFDLSPANVLFRHLDENVQVGLGAPPYATNLSPLLVHPRHGLDFRPAARNAIENLFLASDYVLTSTQLATMEGANEAARRAVNAILDLEGSAHVRCPIWELQEEPFFDVPKKIDDLRLARGRPHFMDEFPVSLLARSPGLLDLVQEALKVPTGLLVAP